MTTKTTAIIGAVMLMATLMSACIDSSDTVAEPEVYTTPTPKPMDVVTPIDDVDPVLTAMIRYEGHATIRIYGPDKEWIADDYIEFSEDYTYTDEDWNADINLTRYLVDTGISLDGLRDPVHMKKYPNPSKDIKSGLSKCTVDHADGIMTLTVSYTKSKYEGTDATVINKPDT